ncbi:MAG: hypothetical protein GY857_19520, partial [Desulfobacula sp.]|nr:hypothetical protein [Desulfobacula sp.]
MKLRKALDKAQNTRDARDMRDAANTGDAKVKVEEEQVTPVKENIKWVAPQYTDSTRYRINPDTVEKNRGVSLYPDSKEIEQYKILRTRIHQQAKNRKMNTIM